MADFEDIQPLVLHNGSAMIKGGFAGSDAPHTVFSTVVGRRRRPAPIGKCLKDTHIGYEAEYKHNHMTLTYPIEHGIVRDWDDMEKIWHHAFYNELRVAPEEHSVLLTDVPWNPKENRAKMTEIMFETFNTLAMCLSNRAALSLFATGRTTGIVLNCGHGVTSTTPVYEGYVLPHAIHSLNFGGTDIANFLEKMLVERSHLFYNFSKRKHVKGLKRKIYDLYIALDYAHELETARTSSKKIYELPDGNQITIGDEHFRCPEILFQPSMIGSLITSPNNTPPALGVHEMLNESITKCDDDIRKELYGNIVLSGGSTMFRGFEDRLNKEISALAPSGMTVNVVAPDDRKYSAWIGGSILATLSMFHEKFCITKDEYDEYGSSIVNRRCF